MRGQGIVMFLIIWGIFLLIISFSNKSKSPSDSPQSVQTAEQTAKPEKENPEQVLQHSSGQALKPEKEDCKIYYLAGIEILKNECLTSSDKVCWNEKKAQSVMAYQLTYQNCLAHQQK